jgi:DNA-binding MarR family transcriptional regulator
MAANPTMKPASDPAAPARRGDGDGVAPPAPRLPDPVDFLHQLMKLENRLMAPFSVHLEKRFAISLNEFRVLMLVGRLGATASHELVDLTGVTAMSISRAVAALERKGRLTATVDATNRRRKILRLTATGEQLYAKMLPSTDQVAHYLFESLSPADLCAFDRQVGQLIASLEATDEAGNALFLERTRPTSDPPGGTGER